MEDLTSAKLETLLQAILTPPQKPQLLRPRPAYLPHPCQRLPRLKGIITRHYWSQNPCRLPRASVN
jgi:hypothetical protein